MDYFEEIRTLLEHLTPEERAEVDRLLQMPIKVDVERFPFKVGGRYWTSEERFREWSSIFPAYDDEAEAHEQKFRAWMQHAKDFSVPDTDTLGIVPASILEMINNSGEEPPVDTHRPNFFLS